MTQDTLEALREAQAMRQAAWARTLERVRKLGRDGHTPTEIQRLLRVSYSTVAKALRAAGIPPTLRPGTSGLGYRDGVEP